VAARFWLCCGGIFLLMLCLDGPLSHALAQTPFGAPRPATTSQAGGLVGWILDKQSEFYRQMSTTIRAAKSDGSAVWTLIAISFAYGIFHAAGPGHGKAVISSYVVANEETARRGILLSFVSAIMQAVVAVGIVGIGAWLLNATAKTMCSAERVIEIASYALIAAFGARLVWSKGGNFLRALQSAPSVPAAALAPAGVAHGHDLGRSHHHDHAHDLGTCSHGHAHTPHTHDAHCGHAHGPEPQQLAGPGGWRRGFGAVMAVGLRPCSGAILVLVFALAQGLFWAGVAATFAMGIGTAITVAVIATLAVSAKGLARRLSSARPGAGILVMRGVEFAAAGLVLLFGLGLLLGYVAAERVTCL
jgi:ABC-type nickel/cobalt efflux system permease component RcnA